MVFVSRIIFAAQDIHLSSSLKTCHFDLNYTCKIILNEFLCVRWRTGQSYSYISPILVPFAEKRLLIHLVSISSAKFNG